MLVLKGVVPLDWIERARDVAEDNFERCMAAVKRREGGRLKVGMDFGYNEVTSVLPN